MSTPLPRPPVRPALADARRAALANLVDYAGLFPPAALDMEGAVAGYRAARATASELLGRFICPAGRLEELAGVLVGSMGEGEHPWPVSMLAADLAGEPARRAADFLTVMGPAAHVDSVEGPLPAGDSPAAAAEAFVTGLGRLGAQAFYLEVAPGPGMEEALDGVAAAAAATRLPVGAKIRCGGLRADLFPSPDEVAAFIEACRQRALPFKATAGLHHPFRHDDPDTGFTHHGFLNLLVATLAAAAGEVDLEEIIADGDPASFAVGRSGVTWRGRAFDASAVQVMRAEAFVGYGSCDFDEPVADLAGLGMLP